MIAHRSIRAAFPPLALLAVVAGSAARGDEPLPLPPPPETPTVPGQAVEPSTAPPAHPPRRFALTANLGEAEYALGFVVRLLPFLRAEACATFQLLPGARAGATLAVPRRGAIPTLTLEAGRVFEGDASRMMRTYGASLSPEEKALMRDLSATYVAALAGLDFASQRRAVGFLRLGVTRGEWKVPGFGDALAVSEEGHAVEADTLHVRYWTFTLRAGIAVYLF